MIGLQSSPLQLTMQVILWPRLKPTDKLVTSDFLALSKKQDKLLLEEVAPVVSKQESNS